MLTVYSGRNAKVRFGAVVVTVKKWTVTVKAEKLDSSNSEGGGYTENNAGLRSADVSIEMDDNATLNYFDAGITAGAIYSTAGGVKLYLNDTASPYWGFPYFFVETVPMSADVHANMGLQITGCNHGPFSYPTGVAGVTT